MPKSLRLFQFIHDHQSELLFTYMYRIRQPRSRRREVRRSLDMAGAAALLMLFVMITHSGARAQTNRVLWITYVEAQRNFVYCNERRSW